MAVKYIRYKYLTVSLLKRLRNGRFASETATATWTQKRFKFKMPAGIPRKLYACQLFQAETTGVVIIETCDMCNMPGGLNLIYATVTVHGTNVGNHTIIRAKYISVLHRHPYSRAQLQCTVVCLVRVEHTAPQWCFTVHRAVGAL